MIAPLHRQRRVAWGLWVFAVAALLASLAGPTPVHAQQDDPPSPEQRLDAAIQQLTAEAEDLDQLGEEYTPPVFDRPHPTMKDWPASMALPALRRMQQDFTGNGYRDTYIRWHLLWAARDVMRQAMEQARAEADRSGRAVWEAHDLPADVVPQLVALVGDMPEALRREQRPERKRVPEALWDQYWALRRETRVQVGYPPFDRHYHWRNALPHVSGERRARVQAAIAKMERLRPRLKTLTDDDAVAYNERIDHVNSAIRQYRGELVYALIQTGDEQMLLRAVKAIDQQVRAQQWMALDMMRYMYLAAFDGYLMLYEPAVYEQAASALERTAKRVDEYKLYRFGEKDPPRVYKPRQRNFAEYAFHMVHLLRNPHAMRWFNQKVPLREHAPRPSRSEGFQYTPYNFTMADIQAARERAIHRLYHPGPLANRLTPQYELSFERMRELRHIRRTDNTVREQEIDHEYGNQALVAWALMAGGESYQDPRLFRRINWSLIFDTPFTFDRGMRLQMLAQMPYNRWRPWIERDMRWLTNALSNKGNWGYSYTSGKSTTWGDHANGAYGLLGLWGAQRAGVEIPLSAWKAVDAHWRATQQSTPGSAPAGWAVSMFNIESEQSNNTGDSFNTRVDGPMTAAGVATLTLTEHYIYGADRTDPDKQNVSSHLQKGINWLDRNFSLTTNDPSANWFYYMWTMQRVGRATGYRTFNGVDWFREVTAAMLNRQQSNGLWEDPTGRQGPLVSTGFALLYLGNSYAPIAISKVRFDGEWNNRPHDIWNFVDHASDQYEVESSWQIVEPDQPIYQLIESPVLYLATDQHFELSEVQVDGLRDYIHAGGLLVLNPDQTNADVARGFRELTHQLFPNLEMRDVPDDHAFYHIHETLRPSVRMRMMHNGVRPLVVQFVRDIGEGLQANDIARSGSFTALNNLYLHSVSLNPRRTRLERHYVVPVQEEETIDMPRSLQIARLTHGGTHDPEPLALPQLKALMAREYSVNIELETIDPTALSDQSLAFLTTIGDAELTDAQARAIRGWLERGGTLWLDAAGGSQAAAKNADALLQQIMPDTAPTRLSSDSPIISGRDLHEGFNNRRVEFRYYALREMGPVTRPRLQTVRVNDRPAIIYSPEDLTAGLAGIEQWGLFGYSVDSARQLAINSILDALN